MVILQDTVAHPLPAWNILRRLDIVRVIRNLSDKNNPRLLVQRIVGYPVSADLVAVFLQLADRLLVKPSSGLMPELNGGVELSDVIVAQPRGQRVQQKLRV